MKKPIILYILLMMAVLFSLSPAAFAEEITEPDLDDFFLEETEATEPAVESCGAGLSWTLEKGKLTVSGSGEMTAAPWWEQKERITEVSLSGVTKVCAGAFQDCYLLKTVDFGGSLTEVGEMAFQNCTGLTSIHLPASFKRFGPRSFEGCTGLTEVYCDGGMPSFRDNCLWTGGYLTIYYPTGNPWPGDAVTQLSQNFGGRLTIVPYGGGSVTPTTAPTTAPITEPTTEPTTAPTTEPTTAPTTEPTTAPTTEPTTVPTTEPTTAPTQAETTGETQPLLPLLTEEPTQPTQAQKSLSGGVFGLLLIILVVTLFAAGALIYKVSSSRKRYEDFDDEDYDQ